MEGNVFSNCNGDFCINLKSLVKICCNDENNLCEESKDESYIDNSITVYYNNECSYKKK